MKPLVANQPKLLPAWSRVTEVSVFYFKTGKPKNVQKPWHKCWVCETAACQNSGFGYTGPHLEVFLNVTKGIQIHAATEEFFSILEEVILLIYPSQSLILQKLMHLDFAAELL